MGLENQEKKKIIIAGIGWKGELDGQTIFQGNDKILASSSLQAEACAMLRGLIEARKMSCYNIHICMDFTKLIRIYHKNVTPIDISNISYKIKVECSKFRF